MKNILVSIDFNEQEDFLMDKAYEFAKAFNAKIWLVHIAAPDPDFVGYDVGPQYIRDARADDLRAEHKLLQDYAKLLEEKGVRAEGLLVQGATVEMLLKEAQKLNTDLIITSHHDHNFFYKAFIGSTSEEIIKESKIPVLMVPLD